MVGTWRRKSLDRTATISFPTNHLSHLPFYSSVASTRRAGRTEPKTNAKHEQFKRFERHARSKVKRSPEGECFSRCSTRYEEKDKEQREATLSFEEELGKGARETPQASRWRWSAERSQSFQVKLESSTSSLRLCQSGINSRNTFPSRHRFDNCVSLCWSLSF